VGSHAGYRTFTSTGGAVDGDYIKTCLTGRLQSVQRTPVNSSVENMNRLMGNIVHYFYSLCN
ncbi:MAG TPA: hypothetical protein PKN29_08160, partial [Candidatus Ozemobacteraceae bacterium]|nr:hypothetical protein [Candidatus Ozemobacteraceae bacterium]